MLVVENVRLVRGEWWWRMQVTCRRFWLTYDIQNIEHELGV